MAGDPPLGPPSELRRFAISWSSSNARRRIASIEPLLYSGLPTPPLLTHAGSGGMCASR